MVRRLKYGISDPRKSSYWVLVVRRLKYGVSGLRYKITPVKRFLVVRPEPQGPGHLTQSGLAVLPGLLLALPISHVGWSRGRGHVVCREHSAPPPSTRVGGGGAAGSALTPYFQRLSVLTQCGRLVFRREPPWWNMGRRSRLLT